jgi:ketosteroid isomerase-like protein
VKKLTVLGIILLLLGCSAAASNRPDSAITTRPQDVAAIQRTMESFHHAVAAHDGNGVSALFLDHGSTWINVLSDKAFAAAKAKDAAAQKIRISNYQDFAAFVSKTKSVLDPRHDHVQIVSDGAVASVYFHFEFLIDGKVENRGDETWQLVKTAGGWRIAAITYSSSPDVA